MLLLWNKYLIKNNHVHIDLLFSMTHAWYSELVRHRLNFEFEVLVHRHFQTYLCFMDSKLNFEFRNDRKVMNADKKRKHQQQETMKDEILEQQFLEQQTPEEETREQETFERCYEDIKHRLNVRSSDDEIRATILGWYLDKSFALPRTYLMNSMVRTYIHWLNNEEDEDNRMTYLQLFERVYPDLKFA